MVRPIFVDHSGRRRRAVVVLGSGLGVLLIVGLIMVAAGLFNGSPIPLPGWPDAVHGEAGNSAPTDPAATPDPDSTPKTIPSPLTITTSPTTSPTHGNGQGTSHRPTKSPGKP